MLIEPMRLHEIRQEQRAALAEGAKVQRRSSGRNLRIKIGEGNDMCSCGPRSAVRHDGHVDAGP